MCTLELALVLVGNSNCSTIHNNLLLILGATFGGCLIFNTAPQHSTMYPLGIKILASRLTAVLHLHFFCIYFSCNGSRELKLPAKTLSDLYKRPKDYKPEILRY